MTQKDQVKVINAGFTIIRADLFRLLIKFKTKYNQDWRVLEKDFKTKKAVLEKMEELLKSPIHIED